MKHILAVAVVAFLLSVPAVPQQSDSALRSVAERDRASRSSDGTLQTLTAAEHLSRGQTYYDNRQFKEAREHFQKIFDNYPTDMAMAPALMLTGRTYMWEREYARAIPFFDRVSREYPMTKEGREGLAFMAACHVRIGKNAEAATIYEQYTVMYPTGERIESAHLNMIDALREAGKYDEAASWVAKVRVKYAGSPTEANALQARLRMEIYRGRWDDAVATAALMQAQAKFSGSMTSMDEVKYLRGLALDKAGRSAEANSVFVAIDGGSYYGELVHKRLLDARIIREANMPIRMIGTDSVNYPTPFQSDIIREAKKRSIDPRFILAIMKQESTFRPGAKSPSAARGLLQLTIDTALKYNKKAGFPNLKPDDLYVPRTNIAIGCEYIAALRDEFGGLNEAIAASYNGGEDNAARWLNRAKPKEAGIFTAEIGFAETKNYVFKVMTNYRIYRELYTEDLKPT